MEKWYEIKKGADFQAIAERFGISPVTARLIRNRGVIGDAAIDKYLNGTCRDLYDPHLLYESEKLVCILSEKIRQGRPIRIIGDYDIDGVMSTYILYQGITRCGGSVSCAIPDRMRDGYGINEHLIDAAYEEGMDTIITCDNGIAAINEIAHAKELGMTVLVTDHHEIPYVEEQGVRRYLRSAADALVESEAAGVFLSVSKGSAGRRWRGRLYSCFTRSFVLTRRRHSRFWNLWRLRQWAMSWN